MIRPGAGAEHRRAGADEIAQRLGQPLALDAERHRRRLAAGDHQRRRALRDPPRVRTVRASAPSSREHRRVRLEVALEGEDADDRRHRYQPRF